MSEIGSDERHPCAGQKGLFAIKPWPKGRVVGKYEGRVIRYRDATDTKYCVGLRADGWWGYCVDGAQCGNHTRFINHFRGIAPEPNVRYATVGGGSALRPFVQVMTTRDVAPGEEFVADYGYEL